jgi:hypothetical protein
MHENAQRAHSPAQRAGLSERITIRKHFLTFGSFPMRLSEHCGLVRLCLGGDPAQWGGATGSFN